MVDLLLVERMSNFLKSGECNLQNATAAGKNEIVWFFL